MINALIIWAILSAIILFGAGWFFFAHWVLEIIFPIFRGSVAGFFVWMSIILLVPALPLLLLAGALGAFK